MCVLNWSSTVVVLSLFFLFLFFFRVVAVGVLVPVLVLVVHQTLNRGDARMLTTTYFSHGSCVYWVVRRYYWTIMR